MIESILRTITRWSNSGLLTLFIFHGANMLVTLVFGKLVATTIAPDVFGTYNLVLSLIAFVTAFFFTPFVYSFRAAFNAGNYTENLHFYRSLLFWVCLILSLSAFVGFSITSYFGFEMVLFSVILVFLQYFQEFHLSVLNLEAKHLRYSLTTLLVALFSLGVLLFQTCFLGIYDISTLFLAVIISQFLGLMINLISKKEHLQFRIFSIKKLLNAPEFKKYIQFVKPLVALPIFTWLLNQGDKFIILKYWSAKEVGFYAAAYGLGSKVFIAFCAPLILYFNPKIYKLSAESSTLKELYDLTLDIVRKYLLAGLVIELLVVLLHPQIGEILLSGTYREAFAVIPVVSLSFLFMTAASFIDQNFYARGLTFLLLRVFMLTAVVNLAANFLMVPGYGISGAAYSMALATLFQLFFQLYQFRKYCKPTQ